ncbi:Histone acetyltransferase mst2 [Colletotrichum sp. SAR 10_70]|nr:Histone acetyltransferase mst2 [Colletotrichum sp. SAR 10_71]KAI8154853.1 Histone acetyltransferase mst2 [Colletotrichum sp. SAR 10_70]KAI8173647.1 Histone acetyltransferase mst2 [Colletotrichum sp. SAR 10_75]KAI8216299.1 Histone acetyltransferase mst2 [Colletotrichum sp. SAR 10_77]KAI8218838.1 Histone acetyltransferase mst2 [Colletotrichum sp. SAR 10_86]
MASAHLTEEQLQQSAVLSEEELQKSATHSDEDAEHESALPDAVEDGLGSTESPLTNPNTHDDGFSDTSGDGDEQRSVSALADDLEMGENTDDASDLSQASLEDNMDNDSEEGMGSRMERDGDDASAGARSRSSSLLDDIEEDEAEGVGAVKIRPGETDDEAELDSEHSDSQSESGNESDGAAAWEDAAGGEEDDEEEGSEDAAPNTCMFCRQDEDNDPGEDFEEYLSCVVCGENSHQHCAREANVVKELTHLQQWKCPECAAPDDEPSLAVLTDVSRRPEPEHEIELELSPSSRRSTASQVARDLLPPQKGPAKPDSHSVFNQLLLDGDPMDGSRVLRKRKTSSVEADEMVMSLRKRRRNASKDRETSHGLNTNQDASDGPAEKDVRRKLRLNPARKSQAVVVTRRQRSIIVNMRVKPSSLRRVLSRKATSNRKRSDRRDGASSRGGVSTVPSTFTATDYSHPFYSFYDRETDEMKTKPYGGILSEAEADTSRTLPANDDRRRFDEAKQKAEEVWRARLQSTQAILGTPAKKPKKNAGPASQIECIDFGGWEIDTWYAAPYPEEYSRNRTLYICEFCLKYMNSDYVAWRHKLKCPAKHPPGDEIYRHGSVSVFEVDGRKNPVYCQNLCLLAKLFLGSKTLYYDVEPFLFYVLYFSYLLTRVERKTGSPEKPLSDMGLVSYRNYWRLVLCRYLLDHISDAKAAAHGLSVRQMSDDTGLTPDDVISALEGLRCLVRDPHTELYAFRIDLAYCTEYISKWERKNYVKLNPDALTWTPYVMGRGNATNFELGPAISAIAPREDDEAQKPAEEAVSVLSQHEPAINGNSVMGTGEKATAIESAPSTNEDTAGDELDEAEVQPAVYESMELHEDDLSNGDSGLAAAHEETYQEVQATQADLDQLSLDNWTLLYRDVPPSRFEVYPPPGGRRADRPRSSVTRPTQQQRQTANIKPAQELFVIVA